jgi:hypothetical protein
LVHDVADDGATTLTMMMMMVLMGRRIRRRKRRMRKRMRTGGASQPAVDVISEAISQDSLRHRLRSWLA